MVSSFSTLLPRCYSVVAGEPDAVRLEATRSTASGSLPFSLPAQQLMHHHSSLYGWCCSWCEREETQGLGMKGKGKENLDSSLL